MPGLFSVNGAAMFQIGKISKFQNSSIYNVDMTTNLFHINKSSCLTNNKFEFGMSIQQGSID